MIFETFIPAFLALGEHNEGTDPQYGSYSTVSVLSNVMDRSSIDKFLRFTYGRNLSEVLKRDKAILYSIWAPGTVPQSVKNTYGLTKEHLLPEDQAVQIHDTDKDDNDDANSEEEEHDGTG